MTGREEAPVTREEVEPDPLADITYHCLGCHSEFGIEVTDEELVGLTGDWRFSAACLLSS